MDGLKELFFDHDSAPGARFLTERELMRLLGFSRTTLWRLRKDGLPTFSVGRSVRYDIEKVRAWIALQGEMPTSRHEETSIGNARELAECHWSLAVALDPKHRPQEPNRPSSTARREWWRFPQEAHLYDREGGRYRRLIASEVAAIQGFPDDWGRRAVQDELLLLRGYGDAVPPPLAEALFSQLASLLGQGPFNSVEICAGFGGLALGESRTSKIHHVALLERWDVACEVLRHSGVFNPNSVRQVDLHEVDWGEFSGIDLLTGGPPCQPWSQGGKGFGADDDRDLLGTMPDVVRQVVPRAFVFENVPGLLSGENEAYARDLVERLRHADGQDSYGVALAVFNAADFGVPQIRRRVFIVGVHGGATSDIHAFFDSVFNSRTHAHPRAAAALNLKPWRKISDVVMNWRLPKSLWRRWPVASVDEDSPQVSETQAQTIVASSPAPLVRIGLQWLSRGSAVTWSAGTWTVLEVEDSTTPSRSLPLIPIDNSGNPTTDPWLVMGDPTVSLDALRRQLGREARLVYLDLPRIRTNAGAFDAADRERVLDTWLSVTRAILRRAVSLLDDRGAIAVLCGIDETNYARLLLDELVGHQNHLGTVAWQKGYSPRNMPNMRELSPVHDNIILFARRKDTLPPVSLRLPQSGYSNRDGDPRGDWKAEQKGANKPDCDYEVHICPYRWELASGTLPPGIWRVSPKSGVIWGYPREVGTWEFTVKVSDNAGATAERSFKFTISENAETPSKAKIPWLIAERNSSGEVKGGPNLDGDLRIVTKSIPDGRLNAEYSFCIVGAGGTPWVGTTRPGKTSAGGNKGRYWEFPQTTLLARAAEDAVDFKSKDDAIPTPKVYATGEDRRLNQTTIWFGRSRINGEGDEDDPMDVDYSQDAKKELAVLEKAGLVKIVSATSKPSKLMARLLALFTDKASTVIDIGSPAAEMAAIATAVGRNAVYVALPPDEETADGLWIPRLRLAARGEHPLPSGLTFSDERNSTEASYIIDGAPRPRLAEAGVFVLRPEAHFASLDPQLGTAAIDYAKYPSGSEKFLAALASVEGMIPVKNATGSFAQSRDGRILGIYLPSSEWVERYTVDALTKQFASHLNNNGRLRIYFHRGPVDPDRISDHRVEMRRIPFALLMAAGLA